MLDHRGARGLEAGPHEALHPDIPTRVPRVVGLTYRRGVRAGQGEGRGSPVLAFPVDIGASPSSTCSSPGAYRRASSLRTPGRGRGGRSTWIPW